MRRINLVPQGERQRTATDYGMLAMIGVLVVIVFGLGMGYYVLSNQASQKKAELSGLEQTTSQLQVQVQALDGYKQLAATRHTTEQLVQKIYTGRTLVADVLDDISQVVPETAWFSTMTIETQDLPGVGASGKGASASEVKAGSLSIDGNAYTFEQVSQVLVRLKLVPSLSGVTLLQAGKPIGAVDDTMHVKGWSVQAVVSPTQNTLTPLPIFGGEVAGQ